MKKAIVVLLSIVGALTLMSLAVAAFVGVAAMMMQERVSDRTVLEVNLERPVTEYLPSDPLSLFTMRQSLTLRGIVDALDKAGSDPKVEGLIATLGASGHGMAVAQEIRDAVTRFREQGKFAIAYSETFGEVGSGNGGYYIATAFDEIWLQPSGDVGLTGLMYESMFWRGTLDKLEVEPRMGQRHEFKNAMNVYTETAYTEPHREAMQALLDSQFEQLVSGIAQGRGFEDPKQVRDLIDRGPFLGAEAVDAGLVDGLGYRDEVFSKALERAGAGADRLFLRKYLERAGSPHDDGPVIALIYAVGTVLRGASSVDPMTGDYVMGSGTVSAALRAALEDDNVKAIVMRVDSPGGSYVASDTIWRETVRAAEANKPVVISMGNVAASGGYFVSMDAAKIVAQPGTITASIGVLGGKMLTEGLWGKVGISWDEVHSSANSSMWSWIQDYNELGTARRDAWLDRVYADFTGKVAAGRGLEPEQVQEIAKGRVWTGQDALKLGLVDALGGYSTALRLAREEAGLAPDAAITVRLFPRKRTPLEELLQEEGDSSGPVLAGLQRRLDDLRPVLQQLEAAGMLGRDEESRVLRMPYVTAAP